MKKFLVLFHANHAARDLMISEQLPETRVREEAWKGWAENNADLIVDFGAPLSLGKVVTKEEVLGGNSTVADYSIVQGESLEGVVERLKDHPHFMTPGDTKIDVLEILTVPGI